MYSSDLDARSDYEYERLREKAIESGLSVRTYMAQKYPPMPEEEMMLIDEEYQRELDESLRALDRIMGKQL